MNLRSLFTNLIPLPLAVVGLAIVVNAQGTPADQPEDRPLRIIAFGGHPDDYEYQMGGTAIKQAEGGSGR